MGSRAGRRLDPVPGQDSGDRRGNSQPDAETKVVADGDRQTFSQRDGSAARKPDAGTIRDPFAVADGKRNLPAGAAFAAARDRIADHHRVADSHASRSGIADLDRQAADLLPNGAAALHIRREVDPDRCAEGNRDPCAESDRHVDTETNSNSDGDSQTFAESHPQTDPVAEADTHSFTQADADSEPNPFTKAEPDAKAVPDPHAKTIIDSDAFGRGRNLARRG